MWALPRLFLLFLFWYSFDFFVCCTLAELSKLSPPIRFPSSSSFLSELVKRVPLSIVSADSQKQNRHTQKGALHVESKPSSGSAAAFCVSSSPSLHSLEGPLLAAREGGSPFPAFLGRFKGLGSCGYNSSSLQKQEAHWEQAGPGRGRLLLLLQQLLLLHLLGSSALLLGLAANCALSVRLLRVSLPAAAAALIRQHAAIHAAALSRLGPHRPCMQRLLLGPLLEELEFRLLLPLLLQLLLEAAGQARLFLSAAFGPAAGERSEQTPESEGPPRREETVVQERQQRRCSALPLVRSERMHCCQPLPECNPAGPRLGPGARVFAAARGARMLLAAAALLPAAPHLQQPAASRPAAFLPPP
ncbi:hypothetical protein Efla_006474 [Eimeria flavescens]